MTPLEYMLDVMGDLDVDPVRRDRMAIAAAQFCHARVGASEPLGKRAAAEENAKTAHVGSPWARILEGRYDTPATPVAPDWTSVYTRPPIDEDE
jgi:hypothetical protein